MKLEINSKIKHMYLEECFNYVHLWQYLNMQSTQTHIHCTIVEQRRHNILVLSTTLSSLLAGNPNCSKTTDLKDTGWSSNASVSLRSSYCDRLACQSACNLSTCCERRIAESFQVGLTLGDFGSALQVSI